MAINLKSRLALIQENTDDCLPCIVVDPAFAWSEFQTPNLENLVLYECHIGSFTGRNDPEARPFVSTAHGIAFAATTFVMTTAHGHKPCSVQQQLWLAVPSRRQS